MDPSRPVNPDPRRALPSVDRLARRLREEHPELPAWAANVAARQVILAAREQLGGADGPVAAAPGAVDWVARAAPHAAGLAQPHPRPVINATGVVMHTNLGRAPIAPEALRAASEAAAGYSSLELDLESGRRGDRLGTLGRKLSLLSGAEAAMACNNNAAAVLLALDTLARGREVVVSRGELVEIGGSFRVPEIMERAGVKLVEVGTTNRTHPEDYERAIGPLTALLLKVHRSNFEQRGFVAEVPLSRLAEIGRAHHMPVIEDLGSGTLVDLRERGFPPDSFAPARLGEGASLVCFSGDKLLGGPQAGLVVGDAAIVAAMRKNPLARALRLDKMTLAALDWTLGALLDGRGEREIPVLQRLLEPAAALEPRARALAERLSQLAAGAGKPNLLVFAPEPDRAPVGGGSLPGFELDTWVVAIRSSVGAGALAAKLRAAPVPVIARVRDDSVVLDLRTLSDPDLEFVEAALCDALR